MNSPQPTLHTADLPVEELVPYHENPRRGDVDAIAESLQVNGQYRAIVVNRGTHTGRPNEVLAGNHTLQAAKALGWDTITAHLIDVDDTAARKIVLVDNRTNDVSTNDDHQLLELLRQSPDLEGTGYTPEDLDDLVALLQDHDWEDTDAQGILDQADEDKWPKVKATLAPHNYARFENAGGDTDEERIIWLLGRAGL